MLVLFRGQTTFTEVPDGATGFSPTLRGIGAPSTSHTTEANEGTSQLSAANVSTVSQAVVTPSAASHDSTPILSSALQLPQSGVPLLLSPVASVVTDLQGPASSMRGGDAPSSGGGGEIARGGESLAPMS